MRKLLYICTVQQHQTPTTMNTQATITDRTEGFVQFSNGFTAERITTQMSGNTMWVCRHPEGAEAKSFCQYRDAIAFCKAQGSASH